MAKAKSEAPKKGGKAKAAKVVATVLRRSPRKAAQSKKKLEAEAEVTPAKVVKKAAPAKKSPSPKKKPSPAKVSKTTASKATRATPPSKKKAATPGTKTPTTASPRPRGRPRKETTPTSTSKVAGVVRGTKSLRGAVQVSEEVANVSAPSLTEDWTDSPKKKKTPSKHNSKKVLLDAASDHDGGGTNCAKGRQASLGGVRKSIEVSDSAKGARAHLKTPSRDASKSRVRASNEAPKSGYRRTSVQSKEGSARSRSMSPVKAATRGRTVLTQSVKSPVRSRSMSPAKNQSKRRSASIQAPGSPVKGRSKSPAKLASQTTKTTAASPTRKEADIASRTRSKSPAKMGPTKPTTSKSSIVSLKSPVAARKTSKTFTRSRSASPVKQTMRASKSPARSPTKQVAKTSGRDPSRSPSVSDRLSPIRVGKTRPSGSPGKRQQQSSTKARSASPAKSLFGNHPGRRSSAPDSSPAKGHPKSPVKISRSPSRRSSDEATFEARFVQANDYGKALRRIESAAYKHTKTSKGLPEPSHEVGEEDDFRARQRGIRRAQLETGLQSAGRSLSFYEQCEYSSCQERQQASTDKKVFALDEDHAKQYRPSPVSIIGDDELSAPATAKSDRASPGKRNASRTSPSSPKKNLSRSKSPGSRQSSTTKEDTAPLPTGQPSAPKRGAIHSVTNPEFIPDTSTVKRNPFFETMPGPEIWHRCMPPYLPFGETPFMEREMSRQINEDLARGKLESYTLFFVTYKRV